MEYQHKVIQSRPRKEIWKWDSDVPYIPGEGDIIYFPEKWKHGERFKVTSVHHYLIDRLVVINVNRFGTG